MQLFIILRGVKRMEGVLLLKLMQQRDIKGFYARKGAFGNRLVTRYVPIVFEKEFQQYRILEDVALASIEGILPNPNFALAEVGHFLGSQSPLGQEIPRGSPRHGPSLDLGCRLRGSYRDSRLLRCGRRGADGHDQHDLSKRFHKVKCGMKGVGLYLTAVCC